MDAEISGALEAYAQVVYQMGKDVHENTYFAALGGREDELNRRRRELFRIIQEKIDA